MYGAVSYVPERQYKMNIHEAMGKNCHILLRGMRKPADTFRWYARMVQHRLLK